MSCDVVKLWDNKRSHTCPAAWGYWFCLFTIPAGQLPLLLPGTAAGVPETTAYSEKTETGIIICCLWNIRDCQCWHTIITFPPKAWSLWMVTRGMSCQLPIWELPRGIQVISPNYSPPGYAIAIAIPPGSNQWPNGNDVWWLLGINRNDDDGKIHQLLGEAVQCEASQTHNGCPDNQVFQCQRDHPYVFLHPAMPPNYDTRTTSAMPVARSSAFWKSFVQ